MFQVTILCPLVNLPANPIPNNTISPSSASALQKKLPDPDFVTISRTSKGDLEYLADKGFGHQTWHLESCQMPERWDFEDDSQTSDQYLWRCWSELQEWRTMMFSLLLRWSEVYTDHNAGPMRSKGFKH